MQIIEEYLARHQLDVPLTKHVLSGFILERTSNEPQNYGWKLHHVYWTERQHTVGCYLVAPYFPVYNVYSHDEYRYNNADHKIPVYFKMDSDYSYSIRQDSKNKPEIEWDHYENYFRENFSDVADRLVFDDKEATVFLWEVFVRAYDSFLALNGFAESQDLIDSLDTQKTYQERYNAYENFIKNVDVNKYLAFKCWSNDLSNFLKKNCNWLKNVLSVAG